MPKGNNKEPKKNGTDSEMAQMLKFLDRKFKITVIHMLKTVRKMWTTYKENNN